MNLHLLPAGLANAFCCALLLSLSACSTSPNVQQPNPSTETQETARKAATTIAWADGQNWQPYLLPGKKTTQFSKVSMDGRDAVLAVADASVSLLRHNLKVPANALEQVRFSWKVPMLIDLADIATREGDDSPVRVVLTFEGDRSKLPSKFSLLSELSRAVTGEELPYATLVYAWCNKRVAGSISHSARTDRVRTITVESGRKNLGQWLDYERDIKADFARAFGEAPGALVGVALMTDADNTASKTKAYYGPVSLGAPLLR